MMSRLAAQGRVYMSVDQLEDTDEQGSMNVPTEFLNSLTISSLPTHSLTLAVGAVVILLRNIDPKNGLCNGTRLVVVCMNDNVTDCKIITASFKGDRSEAVSQRLAFAMTINKSQGQTFDQVGIYLPQPVFSHGQFHVALSRAKQVNAVHILAKRPVGIPFTKEHTDKHFALNASSDLSIMNTSPLLRLGAGQQHLDIIDAPSLNVVPLVCIS
ncbi:hypothetical protein PR048_020805 [Dryococelus australis]|uniref:DNA helicase Pif1-like 2B domain-containing protein n=1 Tax=Dryococelus australis TaxID=614101 RepID=A0ABQ9GWF5_9NEOP|nr:hypothetical protein PR048_020805 [Dryococelus australis]